MNPRNTSQELQQSLTHAAAVVYNSIIGKQLIESERKTNKIKNSY